MLCGSPMIDDATTFICPTPIAGLRAASQTFTFQCLGPVSLEFQPSDHSGILGSVGNVSEAVGSPASPAVQACAKLPSIRNRFLPSKSGPHTIGGRVAPGGTLVSRP